MSKRVNSIVGKNVKKNLDMDSKANRAPALLLIDTSSSMEEYCELLNAAVVKMIESVSVHPAAGNLVDLEVMTFNSQEQMQVKIPSQELYQLVDKDKKLKKNHREALMFTCKGATPTGYALKAALDDLLERYQDLKDFKKSPKMPILFVMSDGLPEISASMKEEHDKILGEQLARIKELVSANKLSVVAVEVGNICDPNASYWHKEQHPQMHKLMRDITGLNDDRHVRQARDAEQLAQFFVFTSSLLIGSSTGKLELNKMDFRQKYSELG